MPATYILIDTLLIGDAVAKPWMKKKRMPSWLARIYERPAAEVSPILIDIEAAQKAGRMNDVMDIVNSQRPQLGVSFIDTELPLNELADHLRQFIFICTGNGTHLTLRFADCVVLSALASVTTREQWAAMTAFISHWRVHGRDGNVLPLLLASDTKHAVAPLIFSDEQIARLCDELGTDELLRNLRVLRPAYAPRYSAPDAYEIAFQSRSIWHSAGHLDSTDLILFTRQVFETDGRLLRVPKLAEVLVQKDMRKLRDDIKRMVLYQY